MKLVAGLFGTVFLVLGIVEMLSSLGTRFGPYVHTMNDPLAGYTLLIISLLYLTGGIKYSKDEKEGLSYIFAASLLAIILAGIEISMVVNDVAEAYVLLSEDYAGWSISNDLYPHLIFGLLAVLTLRKSERMLKAKTQEPYRF